MTTVITSVSNQYDDTSVNEPIVTLHAKNLGYQLTSLELGPDLKFAIYSMPALIFRNYGTIPRRAYISSASIDFEVSGAPNGGNPACWIVPLAKDTLWDPAAGRTGYSSTENADFGARMLDSGPSDIGTSWMTPVSPDEWSFRFAVPGQSERLSQSIKCTSTTDLDYADIRIRKAGSPTGNIWVEVWTDTGDGIPGSKLGQSDNYDVSTVTTHGSSDPATRFTFSTPIAVTSGTNYVCMLDGDWNPALGQVQWSQKFGADPYADGEAATYGLGLGFQYQNYMMNDDFFDGMVAAASEFYLRGNIWSVPSQSIGSIATTPDLSLGLRSYFGSTSYVPGDPIAIVFFEFFLGSPNGRRYFASSTHPTRAAPKLTFEWHPPSIPQAHLDRRC